MNATVIAKPEGIASPMQSRRVITAPVGLQSHPERMAALQAEIDRLATREAELVLQNVQLRRLLAGSWWGRLCMLASRGQQ